LTDRFPGGRFAIALPDDFHTHLRRLPEMAAFARRHAQSFGRALVMPNTLPPIATGETVAAYRAAIQEASAGALVPLMAFKLLPGMGATAVRACAAAGAVAGKYYPSRSTTNSSDGLADPAEAAEALAAMEEAGLPLCVHAEDPASPVLEREEAFIPIIEGILAAYPRLKVVVEHVSSAAMLGFVLASPPRVAATITAHHLLFTLDDLIGEGMDHHLYCKPVLKRAQDRDALREAVFRGEEKLFFGSDSAPHPRTAKEANRGAAGVYSSPTAVAALAGLFDSSGRVGELEAFLSARGAAFYGLAPPKGRLALERDSWLVSEEIDGVVPMLAGRTLAWRATRIA
jgi:dihydroorotase